MKKPDSAADRQEAELVTRLRNGEKAALSEFYLLYVDRLYSLVFHQVGRNKSTAEDIVQEIFIAAFNSIGRFRGDSKLYTWLCSIAYNKIHDFHRRLRRETRAGEVNSVIRLRDLEQIRNDTIHMPHDIESEEARYTVEEVLRTLPLEYQQVLIFKYVEEMSVLEIGKIMDRSPRSIEGLLARARQKWRSRLDESRERF